MLPITGLQKTTLLDYPGVLASTIFLGGCNFRCTFCHNSQFLALSDDVPLLSEEEVLSHLTKRASVLKGVCITGGEMKEKLSGYLQVLFDAEPTSVGGKLPGDDFYYNA